MAPEQMKSAHGVDHRADIYSLGVVFYEMLAGELPIGRFEPPSKKVQIDVRLDEVILRALESEPARRYQHASEMKTDVETISRNERPAPVSAPALPVLLESARRQLLGPAIGLTITGCIAPVLAMVCIATFVMTESTRSGNVKRFWRSHLGDRYYTTTPPNDSRPPDLELIPQPSIDLRASTILRVALQDLFWDSVLSLFIVVGARKMRRLESYGFAVTGAILAMLPILGPSLSLAPHLIVGLPTGIWALIVLNRAQVKAAFLQSKARMHEETLREFVGSGRVFVSNKPKRYSRKAVLIGLIMQWGTTLLLAIVSAVLVIVIAEERGVPTEQLLKVIESASATRFVALFCGLFGTGLGGYVTAFVAKRAFLKHALVMGLISLVADLALLTTFDPRGLRHWTAVAWALGTVPLAVFGGYLRWLQKRLPSAGEARDGHAPP
jgi:hypothetical protein